MKASFVKILTASTLATSLATVAHANPDVVVEKTIGTCTHVKWSDIRLVSYYNPTNQDLNSNSDGPAYKLEVESTSRDRAAGAVYTESVSPVFDTINANTAKWENPRAGLYELKLTFVGTQPLNRSKVTVSFEAEKPDNPANHNYVVKLVKEGNSELLEEIDGQDPFKGPAKVVGEAETNYSYDMINGRWQELIAPALDVLEATELGCTLDIDPAKLITARQ